MPNAGIKLPGGSILNAASQVCPRKADWTQVYACKLFKDENSDKCLDRLREMFVSKRSLHLFSVFVQGLGSIISGNTHSIVMGWEGRSIEEILAAWCLYSTSKKGEEGRQTTDSAIRKCIHPH